MSPLRPVFMRLPVLPVLLLCLMLSGVIAGVLHFMQRDRQALVDQMARERQAQLLEAVRGVSAALESAEEDLRFAGELLAQPGTAEEHRREMRALLEAVGQYKAILVFGTDGQERLRLVDRRSAAAMTHQFTAEDLALTVAQARSHPPGHVISSPPQIGRAHV